jgi:hypothetical protein
MRVHRINEQSVIKINNRSVAVAVLSACVSDKTKKELMKYKKLFIIEETGLNHTGEDFGFFRVVRVNANEIDALGDLNGAKAVLIEGVGGMLNADAVKLRADVAASTGLDIESVRICCSVLSGTREGNYSCYAASALRAYAADAGAVGVFPSARGERKCVSLCGCVKT